MLLVDQEFLLQAQALLGMAKRRIDIATFKAEISHSPRGLHLQYFFKELFKKRDQGVEINFLINWNTNRRSVPLTNLFVIKELKRQKINVRILPNDRCCHAKILIIDRHVAILGSHNLSIKSCHNNFEVSYLIQKPADVARLGASFDHAFLNSKTPQ